MRKLGCLTESPAKNIQKIAFCIVGTTFGLTLLYDYIYHVVTVMRPKASVMSLHCHS